MSVESTTVQIEDVDSRPVNTKYGTKTVYNVKASDGRRYGTFDAELGQKAGTLRGQTVQIGYSVRQSGEYTNYDLKSIEVATSQVDTTSQAQSLSGPSEGLSGAYNGSQGPSVTTSKDTSIARAVALKAAVDLASNGVIEDATLEGLLVASDFFADWLLHGSAVRPTGQEQASPTTPDPGDTDVVSQVTGDLVRF